MKQIFAIFLSVLFLSLNVGGIASYHYWGGELASSAFTIGSADVGCGMEEEESFCDSPFAQTIAEKSCCENEYVQLELDEEYHKTTLDIPDFDYNFLACFVISYVNQYSFDFTKKAEYLEYSPPLLGRDILVLNQSFLI